MRRSSLITLIAVPFVIAGMYWLMLHGYLELTAWLLVVAVIGLVVAAIWEWRHDHPRWAALLCAGAVVTAGTVGLYGLNLNAKLDRIHRADDAAIHHGKRPEKGETGAVNILLMGADDRTKDGGPTIADRLADGSWDPGAYRSDTMMVVHISADRRSAYFVSIPRDSYVPIYDDMGSKRGRNKINAAFSYYGPFGTWRTVENLADLRLDHMAVIDFAGFRDLTTAVGGVDVYVPQETYDEKAKQTWTKGWHHVEGELALKYVRQRYGLAEGDFSRVDRQQNFLRAVMEKMMADDTIGNPVKLTKTLDAVTAHLTVDESWTTDDIRSLALSLRGLSADNVTFVTLPLGHYETVDNIGSVNIIDAKAARQLWTAVKQDRMDEYVKAHPDDELGAPTDVS